MLLPQKVLKPKMSQVYMELSINFPSKEKYPQSQYRAVYK